MILGNFTETKRNYDLYDSSILKGITLLIYISEIISSVVMFAFVRYVKSGDAGSYRTFNNQLLAYLYGGVRLSFYCNRKHLLVLFQLGRHGHPKDDGTSSLFLIQRALY